MGVWGGKGRGQRWGGVERQVGRVVVAGMGIRGNGEGKEVGGWGWAQARVGGGVRVR